MRAFLLVALAAAASLLPVASAQDGAVCVENLSLAVDQDRRQTNLSWDAVAGAGFYDVFRALDGHTFELRGRVEGAPLVFEEQDVPLGVVDYAVAVDGVLDASCPVASAHLHGPHEEPPAPECVAGLSVVADGRAARLSWLPVEGAASYDVLRAVGDGAFAPLLLVGDGSTTARDADVVPGTTYRYQVSANGLPPEGDPCPAVAFVAVPEFPGLLVAGAAGIAALAAFVALRRRG